MTLEQWIIGIGKVLGMLILPVGCMWSFYWKEDLKWWWFKRTFKKK